MRNHVLLSALAGAASVTARDIPSNVQNFYNSLKTKGNCSNKLATGFYARDDGPNSKPQEPLLPYLLFPLFRSKRMKT